MPEGSKAPITSDQAAWTMFVESRGHTSNGISLSLSGSLTREDGECGVEIGIATYYAIAFVKIYPTVAVISQNGEAEHDGDGGKEEATIEAGV
jgi:hypothetical protein